MNAPPPAYVVGEAAHAAAQRRPAPSGGLVAMRSKTRILVPAVLTGAMLLAQVPIGNAATRAEDGAAQTVRISIARNGEPNNISGRSSRPAVNTDGQVVAFDSIATNLVRRDKNRENDVFVRDRTTGVTERVSVSSSGKQGNDPSSRPSISGDGNLVVFDSSATNLVPGDTNHLMDVFLHDRTTDRTVVVSRARNTEPANGTSFAPVISENGRYVVFPSDATNLVTDPVVELDRNIYLRDLQARRFELISLTVDGEAAGGGTFGPSVSADGRFVAYASFSPNIVVGDTNDTYDIFVRDRVLDTTDAGQRRRAVVRRPRADPASTRRSVATAATWRSRPTPRTWCPTTRTASGTSSSMIFRPG